VSTIVAEEPTPTVLGAGSHFDGLLTFRGSARVEGILTGTIQAKGRLEVGPRAHVQAEVDVDELVVEGLIEGDVRANDRVELRATGKVIGSLAAPRVQIAEGSVLQGQCRMKPPAAAETAPEAPVEPQTRDSATETA
jgi:cytoskeletal protein CcmA (bactofilin family)